MPYGTRLLRFPTRGDIVHIFSSSKMGEWRLLCASGPCCRPPGWLLGQIVKIGSVDLLDSLSGYCSSLWLEVGFMIFGAVAGD